ncbi:MAG TPA: response regulator transcription factor [Dehalococcoidales bacterium]|nr:response regulator transcription factor [Dehalococcoidales bacterium]
MKRIRILIVDDHTLVRQGIRALLGLNAEVEIVGEGADGREAIDLVRVLKPDIVLMDLAMRHLGGIEATRIIRREFPSTKVIALTQYDDSEYVIPVVEAGARGFVNKMASPTELSTAIQAVYRGESYLSSTAAAALVDLCQTETSGTGDKEPYFLLSDREKETLKLVAEGLSTREIAEKLVVSPKTVEWYKANLMAKLNLHKTSDLIKFAIRKKIVTL